MREASVKVLRLDELSEEAKDKAYEEWYQRQGEMGYFWGKEGEDVIEAFEKEFNVRIKDWKFDSWTYNFNLDLSAIDDKVLGLKGNRARAWFWNNHGNILLSPQHRYYTRTKGNLVRGIGLDSVCYKSKVFKSRVYDGTCPLTGYCMDCEALAPIAEFCFGIEWNKKERKRIPSSRKLYIDGINTVESLLYDGVNSLFMALRDDWKFRLSKEFFEEECDANDYEFMENGKMWRY